MGEPLASSLEEIETLRIDAQQSIARYRRARNTSRLEHSPICPVEAKDDGYSSCTCGVSAEIARRLKKEYAHEPR